DDELKTAFTTWRDLLTYCAKYGVHTESFAARLLMADARAGDETALEADFFDLRRHFCERQAELDGIFSSNTWKLAKLLEKSSSWRITELLKKFV
ncbi:MAG: hypothetical protein RRY38_01960, partial [Oscillospiraceae bacterium]